MPARTVPGGGQRYQPPPGPPGPPEHGPPPWWPPGPIEVNIHVRGYSDPRLDQIINMLTGLKAQGETHMALTSEALDAVREANGKTESLITLVGQLHEAILNIPSGMTPEQKADVDAVFSISKKQAADVQAALDANPLPTTP